MKLGIYAVLNNINTTFFVHFFYPVSACNISDLVYTTQFIYTRFNIQDSKIVADWLLGGTNDHPNPTDFF